MSQAVHLNLRHKCNSIKKWWEHITKVTGQNQILALSNSLSTLRGLGSMEASLRQQSNHNRATDPANPEGIW